MTGAEQIRQELAITSFLVSSRAAVAGVVRAAGGTEIGTLKFLGNQLGQRAIPGTGATRAVVLGRRSLGQRHQPRPGKETASDH